MRRRHVPVILGRALLGLALLGCDPSEQGLDISVHMAPLIAQEATRAFVVLYNASPPNSCEVIRLSEKDEQMPKRGTDRKTVDLAAGDAREAEFFDVFPGDYQIAVFVYDGSKTLIGFGCLPIPLTIELGKRTEAPPIEVKAIPGG